MSGDSGSQVAVLLLGWLRLGIAIGLIVLQHVPGDGYEFARGGYDGDVAIFLLGNAAEEDAERPGMAVEMLDGFD